MTALRNKFLAFISGDSCADVVRKFAEKNSISPSLVVNGNVNSAIAFLKTNKTPNYLLIEIASKETAIADLNSLAEVCEPDVKVIVCGDINELSFYKQLMDFGVDEYLLKPFTESDLVATFNKINSPKQNSQAETTTNPAKKIAVIGTRGGSGSTSLALNLGLLIAKKNQTPTVLVDFDSQFGTVSLDLDLEPSRGFKEALEKPERVDSMFLDRLLIRRDEVFSILSSEESFEEEYKISEESGVLLIAGLEKKFQTIICEMPRFLRKHHLKAINVIDDIIIISEPSVAGLRDAMRLCEFFVGKMQKQNIKVIVNKIGMSKKHEMPIPNFEKSIKRKVDFQIPYEAEIYGYSSTGKPLAEINPNSKFLKTIGQVADSYIENKTSKNNKKSSTSIFSKVFKAQV